MATLPPCAWSYRRCWVDGHGAFGFREGMRVVMGDPENSGSSCRADGNGVRARWSGLVTDLLHAGDQVAKLLFRGPAGGLAEATVGGEGEAIGRGVLEAGADAERDIVRGFDVVALHVDDADGGVDFAGD